MRGWLPILALVMGTWPAPAMAADDGTSGPATHPGPAVAAVAAGPLLSAVGGGALVWMAFHTDAPGVQSLFWPTVGATAAVTLVGVPLSYGLGYSLAGRSDDGGAAYLRTRPLVLALALGTAGYGLVAVDNPFDRRLLLGLIGLEAGAGLGELLGGAWSALDVANGPADGSR